MEIRWSPCTGRQHTHHFHSFMYYFVVTIDLWLSCFNARVGMSRCALYHNNPVIYVLPIKRLSLSRNEFSTFAEQQQWLLPQMYMFEASIHVSSISNKIKESSQLLIFHPPYFIHTALQIKITLFTYAQKCIPTLTPASFSWPEINYLVFKIPTGLHEVRWQKSAINQPSTY